MHPSTLPMDSTPARTHTFLLACTPGVTAIRISFAEGRRGPSLSLSPSSLSRGAVDHREIGDGAPSYSVNRWPTVGHRSVSFTQMLNENEPQSSVALHAMDGPSQLTIMSWRPRIQAFPKTSFGLFIHPFSDTPVKNILV